MFFLHLQESSALSQSEAMIAEYFQLGSRRNIHPIKNGLLCVAWSEPLHLIFKAALKTNPINLAKVLQANSIYMQLTYS